MILKMESGGKEYITKTRIPIMARSSIIFKDQTI